MTGTRLLTYCSLFLFCGRVSAGAEPPDAQTPHREFECRWAAGSITLDGKADDPAWAGAQRIDHFYLPWLGKDARSAKTATRARLLWDRESLYFFAEMEDADLYADVLEHDGRTWDNDVFKLFFKPGEKEPGYYEFQVNAAQTVLDIFWPRRNVSSFDRFKKDGEFHLEAQVVRKGTLNRWQDRDKFWSVEGKIPWRDFIRTGGRPAVDEIWRFALCRHDYSVDFEGPELSTCAPLKDRADFHNYENYAQLRFMGPARAPAEKTAVNLKPYVTTSRITGSPEPPLPYRAQRVLPNLKISWPICVAIEPGSSRMWFIDERDPYGPSTLLRTTEDPATGDFKVLLKYDAIAYSIAFHPDYEHNGYVYLSANGHFDGEGQKTRIIRYAVERTPPSRFQPDSATTIIEWPAVDHNGGGMVFGTDGMLYVTAGDGTNDSDANIVGQDLSKLNAKVLRIDVDHPQEGKAYSVPSDNPFINAKNTRPETWAYGLRNPWRITVDPHTGQLWVGNNGQDLWEQVYLIERGANYGWSLFEGSHPFYLNRAQGPTSISKPTLEHPHSEARSLTGGVVYYGKKFPELRGAYLYGDYSTGKIWGVKHDGQQVLWHQELADTTLQITSFAIDREGELLITDHQGDLRGGLYTLEPNSREDSQVDFPRRLRDSGLFQAVAKHEMQPGVIPYSVNSPLWSDGAQKQRYLALPPTMVSQSKSVPAKISVTNRSWAFPDDTVLIKSFSLDLKAGDPASRRWIETRLLTKQAGEWVGYSYQWNDEQTDAMLVDKAGLDREFAIDTSDGVRRQIWHYPSRAECMVCHSREAGFVLGLTTLQLNRNHDYGGGHIENQLALLERLELLDVNWHNEAVESLRKEFTDKGLPNEEVEGRIGNIIATRDQRTASKSGLLYQSPAKYACLADPYDAQEPLEKRARSYLQVNCAGCHIKNGGGNAKFDVAIETPLNQMKLLDVKPQHQSFGIENARLIAPGDPQRSVLLHRISHREAGQMPPLGTSMVDAGAVALLEEWIAGLAIKNKGNRGPQSPVE